ncbi:MAG: nitroreductase family protein [Bacteroidales bacterium]|jgi:nitroreductase|nr:nitroreductase family protein [Bacteroidales bacterium]
MADNYLEKRYEETLGANKPKVKRIGHTVDSLLLKNRSTRGYKKSYVVSPNELERIVGVCTKIPSARNQQVLRFRLVTRDSGANQVLPLIKMGAALPDLHLPFPGTEPEAFIVICSTVDESPLVDIDLGIATQSMLLKAAEMGLNGLIIGAFNRTKLQETLDLPYPPLLVLTIGKGDEHIELIPIDEGENHSYYRKEGIHYVPKVRIADLII